MKKSGMTARVAAIVLAASMVMTNVLPTFAAEDVSVETTEKGAVSGVSKVIGLQGEADWRTMGSAPYQAQYSYVNSRSDSVYVTGTVEAMKDASNGLYKNGADYYTDAVQVSPNVVELSYKVVKIVALGEYPSYEEDANTGLYLVDGKYYKDLHYAGVETKNADGSTSYKTLSLSVVEEDEVQVIGSVAAGTTYDTVYATYGKKLNPADTYYSYYLVNGKAYRDIYISGAYDYNTYTYVPKCVYVSKYNEISFDKKYQTISWNPVSNVTEVDSNGKYLNVGYQIRINDQDVVSSYVATNGSSLQTFTMGNSYTTKIGYTSTEKNKYEVRAVYYTATENYVMKTNEYTQQPYEDNAGTSYQIVKTGAWSEPFTYAWSMPTVPAVANLKFTQQSVGKGELSWSAVKAANGYEIWRAYSDSAVVPTDGAFDKIGEAGSGATHYSITNSALNGYNYAYYKVRAFVQADAAEILGGFSNVVSVGLDKRTNTPAINNLQIEQKLDGSFDLTWNEIDASAQVVVFASQEKAVFNTPEYTYRYLNLTAQTAEGSYDLDDVLSLRDKLQILNKKVISSSFVAGTNRVSSTSLNLEPGKKYYFVVATLDTVNHSTDRSSASKYVFNVAKAAGQTKNVSFGFYNDIVTSKTVSATPAINISQPSTKSGKTSVTMNFSKGSNVTGYQIYRKNSKGKFTKIATINSAQYVDKELKANTVYDYQVRGYYYNPDTKKTAYSDYVYFSAETGSDKFIELKATKASTTSIKLSWTKVSGVTQYDIYRSYMAGTDTNYSQSNNSGYGYGDGAYALYNAKWEKVKTITNTKTTTYTDKKLKKGTSYTYRIVATYASGKAERQVWASDAVVMKVTMPQNVKLTLSKNNVKVTWDKDSYASKYQIRYKKYDAEGRPAKLTWTTASTKKTSYTIKSIAQGGWVDVQVRAYGSKKWSSYTGTYTKENGELSAAKGVTAKEATETAADGKTKNTVINVTWKKVSGAAYYRVFRSTSPVADYNADKKVYYRPDDTNWTLISKEGNDDETYANVFYKDYKNVTGSVVGTKAVDRARLQTGVTYYYYVAAYSENGTRVSAGYATPASICYKATPVISKITATKGKVTIKIAKVTGAKKYEIYRSTKKTSGFTKIGTSTKTSYVDKTVTKGKTYYYRVIATGSGTNGLKGDLISNVSATKKIKAK